MFFYDKCSTLFSKNHKSEFINETTDMPDELVKNVGGTTIFEQTMPQVRIIMI